MLVKCLATDGLVSLYRGEPVTMDSHSLHTTVKLAVVKEWVVERCGEISSLPADYDQSPLWRAYTLSYMRGAPAIRQAIRLTCQADVHLRALCQGEINVGISTVDPDAYGAIAVGVVKPTYYAFWGVEHAKGVWQDHRVPNVETVDGTAVDGSATLSVAAVVADAHARLRRPNAVFYTAEDGVWLYNSKPVQSCEVFALWPASAVRV